MGEARAEPARPTRRRRAALAAVVALVASALRTTSVAASARRAELPGASRCDQATSRPSRGDRVDVTVDLAAPPAAATSEVGFNHGASATTPPDELVTPLAPALWRVGKIDPAMDARIARWHAREVVALSDLWGYPPDSRHPWPYRDLAGWQQLVRDAAAKSPPGALFEVWNEPDHPRFFGEPDGAQAQQHLFRVYEAAFHSIRAARPDAAVGGPSLTHFKPAWLEAFLADAERRHVEVDFLVWHQAQDDDIPGIPGEVRHARALIAAHPATRTREIVLDEIGGPCAQNEPGDLLGYFFYLEKAGVDAAARSCWREPRVTPSSCYDDSLNALLEPRTLRRRAAWWTYRAYAEGLAGRIPATVRAASPDAVARVAALASAARGPDGPGYRILLGYLDYEASPAETALQVHLERVPASVRSYRLERIPLTQPSQRPLDGPELAAAGTLQVRDGAAEVAIEHVRLHEAYVLRLE